MCGGNLEGSVMPEQHSVNTDRRASTPRTRISMIFHDRNLKSSVPYQHCSRSSKEDPELRLEAGSHLVSHLWCPHVDCHLEKLAQPYFFWHSCACCPTSSGSYTSLEWSTLPWASTIARCCTPQALLSSLLFFWWLSWGDKHRCTRFVKNHLCQWSVEPRIL